MRQNIARRYLFLPAIVALTMARGFAADVAATIQPLTSARTILANCTDTVQKLSKTPVPANHAAARTAVATNAAVQKGQLTGIGQQPIPPEDQQFINAMEAGKQQLASCSKQFAALAKSVEDQRQKFVAALEKAGTGPSAEWPQADARKVAQEFDHYDTAHQDFVKAVLGLSGNQQMQSYLHQSILDLINEIAPAAAQKPQGK